ncbi:HAD hydrolase-like protein [Shinella curvata]|uniref:HAD hydrolase-like protein n=2 Tax=Shinella curvata TaxID=1817964 RepID=A0ABT8XII5_9HYPH|nr:HAD hydrolase-like protein [Shinella curvata]MCJ8055844.1 HAD hydrolase-like protein [Shinella curvata]MDO6123555.1 HAD hydrolase-like protein [Shinella curvata]
MFGKPHPAIYRHAQSLVSSIAADRIVFIGDSIEHDIAGAAGAGLASRLVRTGVLATRSEDDLARLSGEHGAPPDFLMERLTL